MRLIHFSTKDLFLLVALVVRVVPLLSKSLLALAIIACLCVAGGDEFGFRLGIMV